MRSSPIQDPQSPARFTASPLTGPQTSSSKQRANPFAPKQSTFHRALGSIIKFYQFTNPLGINTELRVHLPKGITYVSTAPRQALKPTASWCSLGQLKNEYVEEGRDKRILLECLPFPINPRFMERFWHLSKYFFALADRQNDYLNLMSTRDVALYRFLKTRPLLRRPVWFFLHPTYLNANNTIHNYLFGEPHIHRTNLSVHVNSRLQYANSELILPYYLNYSYVINTNYCESTLHNFDAKKDCLLFSQFNARTHRPILVHIEHLQCGEGGATNCMYEETFNLLHMDWIIDKLENRDPTPEGSIKLLKAMQPNCNTDLYPRALAACLSRDKEFVEFFRYLDNRAPDFEIEFRT